MRTLILASSFMFLVLSNNSNAANDKATCVLGECEFFIGIWYEKAETMCMDNLFMEDVDQGPLSFTIKKSGKKCMVFNER
jgi:hypothetical protein